MTDTNVVILIGRLTRDCEVKTLQNGTKVLSFNIAVNSTRKVQDNWVEEASFIDIVAFGRIADTLEKFLVKGKQVCVQGELKQSRWEKDGQKQSRINVLTSSIQLLGDSKSDNGATNAPSQSDGKTYNRNQNSALSNPQRYSEPARQQDLDDFIPF